jgi:hypothetical protein
MRPALDSAPYRELFCGYEACTCPAQSAPYPLMSVCIPIIKPETASRQREDAVSSTANLHDQRRQLMTALTLNALSRSLGLSPRGRGIPSVGPSIVADGLIAHWPFDQGAG